MIVRRAACLSALVVAACGALLAPGGATAAVGDLSAGACIGYPIDNDCEIAPIQAPRGVAVSPDGKSVYAAAGNDALAVFSRGGPDGKLSYKGCLGNTAVDDCTDLPGAPIDNPWGVAVSADGSAVYVTAAASDSIAHFARAPDGALTFAGCISRVPQTGCTPTMQLFLAGATGVAASPDGGSVYTTASAIDAVTHLFRNPLDGSIVLDGCLGNTADWGCGDLPNAPIDGPSDVAVSPDSKSVYVVSPSTNSIAHFFASGNQGQIYYDGCFSSRGESGCADLPGHPLDGAAGVDLSPDGKSVYVTSLGSDSVSHFVVSGPKGQLSYYGCAASDDAPGCVDVPGTPLKNPHGVAVTPDGSSVYVTGLGSDSIAHFRRAADTGALDYAGCLARENDNGQRCVEAPGRGLNQPWDIAISPDGASLYVTAPAGHAVTHLFRSLVGDPEPGPGDTPTGGQGGSGGSENPPPAVMCGGRRATIVGTKHADRLRGTRGRDVIAALGGNDRVSALGRADVVCGGRGRDTLLGGRGRDRLLGGPQRDTCIGGAARDRASACETRRSL
ncbi:MAG TPA: beta-propeller fold lactonase family protein [Thermoleophilaceae bacterium]